MYHYLAVAIFIKYFTAFWYLLCVLVLLVAMVQLDTLFQNFNDYMFPIYVISGFCWFLVHENFLKPCIFVPITESLTVNYVRNSFTSKRTEDDWPAPQNSFIFFVEPLNKKEKRWKKKVPNWIGKLIYECVRLAFLIWFAVKFPEWKTVPTAEYLEAREPATDPEYVTYFQHVSKSVGKEFFVTMLCPEKTTFFSFVFLNL